MQTASPGLVPRGAIDLDLVDRIATNAIRAAARPPWSDPMVIAFKLGFALLPCLPGSAPEWERTTTEQLAFAAEPDPRTHAERVRFALARGLLLRAGVPHTVADAHHLARRLRQIPE
jgi:hypothetical protein